MAEPVPTSATSDAAPGVSEQYEAARDRVLALREDYDRAREEFRWPRMEHFNYALDWFDHVARDPERGARDALWIVEEDGTELRRTFRELAGSSARTANWLRGLGVRPPSFQSRHRARPGRREGPRTRLLGMARRTVPSGPQRKE